MIETKNKPYYDDYDPSKGFIKVLFKPGISVQTRELNQLQSILQNQIGCLADSVFKDGSVVKDGRIIFKNDVSYVKLVNSYNDVNFSYNNYKGRMVYGATTKIVASVFDGFDTNNNNPGTLYLNYLGSGVFDETDDNIGTFQEGEVLSLVNEIYVTQIRGDFYINEIIHGENSGAEAKLIVVDNNKLHIVYTSDKRFIENETITGNSTNASCIFAQGETEQYQCQINTSANTINPLGVGSFVLVSSGIYYIDGYFVNVEPQQIIISEYNSIVSAKVGFNKEVKYITASDDISLYDNANGSPNENAPGADRLYLELNLGYYNLYDNVPDSFIEILRINNSNVVFNNSNNSQWSNIIDLLAKRTYDESGNYTVNPFIVDIQEFLNENDNNGIYTESYFAFNSQIEALNASMSIFDQESPGSSHLHNYKYYPLANHEKFLQACKDRVCLGVNPGLAYVLGYEVNLENKLYIPMLKARTPGIDNNSWVNVKYGNYCLVHDVNYLPDINSIEVVNLYYDELHNTQVGTARVRMIAKNDDNSYKLYLTDISMNEGETFQSRVRYINSVKGSFNCAVSIDESNYAQLHEVDKTTLIYKLPQNAVKSLEDVTYEYSKLLSGVVDTDRKITYTPDTNSRFFSDDSSKYILTMTSGNNAGEVVDLSGLITIESNGTLVITLPELSPDPYTGQSFELIASIRKSGEGNVGLKTKILTNADSGQIEHAAASAEEIVLNYVDGYRLVGVYDSGDPNVDASKNSTNVTSNYIFDGGQRDDFYDRIRIKRIENAAAPSGKLLAVFDYFAHTIGDYFTAESYTNAIDYEDIPIYTNESGVVYDLKNCIDLRPRISADGAKFESGTQILSPNTNFESDVSYYLPRIDLLEVDYLGNFKIKQGTSAVNPQTPVGDLNAMILYYFEIPSYTQNVNDIVKRYKENKRFTMRDIGILETRINAMENYILLTQNEYDISNMPIFGDDKTERYKTGYIADNFNDHSYGEISNANYKCAIDISNNTLRPSFKLNTVNLVVNNLGATNVIEMNGKYMIPKTDVEVINQTVGTSLQRMNENGLVSWTGNLLISPSVNNQYNNINQNRQNVGQDIDYLNELNAVIANTDNTLEYGNFFTEWLGVN